MLKSALLLTVLILIPPVHNTYMLYSKQLPALTFLSLLCRLTHLASAILARRSKSILFSKAFWAARPHALLLLYPPVPVEPPPLRLASGPPLDGGVASIAV